MWLRNHQRAAKRWRIQQHLRLVNEADGLVLFLRSHRQIKGFKTTLERLTSSERVRDSCKNRLPAKIFRRNMNYFHFLVNKQLNISNKSDSNLNSLHKYFSFPWITFIYSFSLFIINLVCCLKHPVNNSETHAGESMRQFRSVSCDLDAPKCWTFLRE